MGGEKLNASEWYPHNIFLTLRAVFLIAGVFIFVSPLFSQEQEAAVPTAVELRAAELRAAELQAAEQAMTFDGAGAGAPDGAAISREPVSVFVILRTILVLALVAAAIYGIVYLFKKMARPAQQQDPHLRVLASAHLGQNRFAHVITLGTKAWLVGASDGGVNLIAELEEQEAVDALLLDESRRNAETRPGPFPDFKALLRRLGAGQPPHAGSGPMQGDAPNPGSPLNNIRQRRERLKGL
ncbi:hypothetical protein AGMMS49546_19420 [Spirochaetia bacterium]|nr:hypothetical protein AGMMS49546_19420 [Spirochaetia bacterium]